MNVYDYLSILTYGMIGVSYMMRDMQWLRTITVVTCVFDIVIYTLIRPGQPLWVQVIANVAILFINGYFLCKLIAEKHGLKPNEYELALYRAHFGVLSEIEFMRFFRKCKMSVYTDGYLYTQGDEISRVMIILSGSLTRLRDGVVVGTFEVGDVVGATSLLAKGGAVYSVVCNGTVDVLEIDLSDMDSLVAAHPDMKASILAWKGYHVSRSMLRVGNSCIGNVSSGVDANVVEKRAATQKSRRNRTGKRRAVAA